MMSACHQGIELRATQNGAARARVPRSGTTATQDQQADAQAARVDVGR